MIGKHFVLAALLASLVMAGTASAEHVATATDSGLDAAARARLVGTHKMSLQWLDWGDLDHAGSVEIRDRGGILTVDGSETRDEGRLDIQGHIVSASQDGFVFQGAITLQGTSPDDQAPCTRSGTLHFRTTGTRKYWRLQEMQSPCGTATDYVDIYFLGV